MVFNLDCIFYIVEFHVYSSQRKHKFGIESGIKTNLGWDLTSNRVPIDSGTGLLVVVSVQRKCKSRGYRWVWGLFIITISSWVLVAVANSGNQNYLPKQGGGFNDIFVSEFTLTCSCYKPMKSLHVIGKEQICEWKSLTRRFFKEEIRTKIIISS